MSTLFCYITKTFISKKLELQIEESKKQDNQPAWSKVISPRNLILAEEKRVLLSELIQKIANIGVETDDHAFAEHIITLLDQYKSKSNTAAIQHHQSLGGTEMLLQNLKQFVEDFFKKMNSCQLVDYQEKKGSFFIFLKIIGFYYANRQFKNSANTSFFSHPNITSINEYHGKIDKLVDDEVYFALDNLQGQYKNDEGYLKRETALGLQMIDYLRLKNNEIRQSYLMTLTNAFSFLPRILDEYLEASTLWLSLDKGILNEENEEGKSSDFIMLKQNNEVTLPLEEQSGSTSQSELQTL